MIFRLLFAALLLAHGAIHAAFVAPRPPVQPGAPSWPFDLGHSWALSSVGATPEILRLAGLALIAVSIAGFALAAVATVGVLPAGVWGAAVTIGSVASLVLLAVFFHPWLVIGVLLDLGLLWVAVVLNWTPDRLG